MNIIEVPQGYYGDLEGVPKTDAIDMFAAVDEAFLQKYPNARAYHSKSWREHEVPETSKAPWGYEWYRVDESGVLHWHSAHYDTSG